MYVKGFSSFQWHINSTLIFPMSLYGLDNVIPIVSIYNLRMFSKVFEKGEEWLKAYEKYLKNGNLKLDLKQMKLEEDEKVKVQRAKEQQIVQFHQQLQQALSIFQPDFNDLRDILSQRDLRKFLVETQQRHLELAYREVMESNSENLIAEMVQTQNAIIEYKAVWPPRLLRFLLHVFLQPEVQS